MKNQKDNMNTVTDFAKGLMSEFAGAVVEEIRNSDELKIANELTESVGEFQGWIRFIMNMLFVDTIPKNKQTWRYTIESIVLYLLMVIVICFGAFIIFVLRTDFSEL